MPLAPVEEAVAAIARGEIVVVVDDEDRENEGDLIIAADDEALDFVANRSEGVLGTPPVVFCGVNSAAPTEKLPRERYTGLIEVFNSRTILDLIMRLRPGARTVYFVADSTPFGASMSATFQGEIQRHFPGITFQAVDGRRESLESIRATVAAVRPDSVVLLSQFRQDKEQRYIDAAGG